MIVKLTEQLGIYGWSHLDPVLLAALAMRAPVLLVGAHGTGKSMLIERLASALGLTFRHYNASLLNYDDLVGIPVPENGGLRFISTPGAIWDAEFIFFDEISRCRPDLQNKLFPVIYEKRVAGLDLPNLEHCWAAMNPPAALDFSDPMNEYIGSEQLDLALADRFHFILKVPAWKDLDQEVHHKIIKGGGPVGESRKLDSLIVDCRKRIRSQQTVHVGSLGDYVVSFMDLLQKAGFPQSPRRARMLVSGMISVKAALEVLGYRENTLANGAELVSRYGLPLKALPKPPSPVVVLAAQKQAWELSQLFKDKRWRLIMMEPDLLVRINLADELNMPDDVVSRLITQALSSEPSEERCMGLSAILFLKYQARRDLAPGTWELLTKNAARILAPRAFGASLPRGKELDRWQEISKWLAGLPNSYQTHLERNFILGGFPDLWRRVSWRESLQQFRMDILLLKLKEVDNGLTS